MTTGESIYPRALENMMAEREPPGDSGDVHLRSSLAVSGYRALGSDGPIGRISDFLFDGQTWKITYLEVSLPGFFRRRRVLVPNRWAAAVSWERRELSLSLGREVVRSAPTLEPSARGALSESCVDAYYDCAAG